MCGLKVVAACSFALGVLCLIILSKEYMLRTRMCVSLFELWHISLHNDGLRLICVVCLSFSLSLSEGEFEVDPGLVESRERLKKEQLKLTLDKHLAEKPSHRSQVEQLSPRFATDVDTSIRGVAFDLENRLKVVSDTLEKEMYVSRCLCLCLCP